MPYSNDEYLQMIIIYGECNRNANATVREYAARFPNMRHPSVHVILRLIQRVSETGSVLPSRNGAGGPTENVRNVAIEEAVLEAVEEDPTRSVRTMARLCGTSATQTHRILRRNQHHPYHYTRVQHLEPADYPRRLEFCRWLLEQNRIDPNFSKRILFTDECCFTKEGLFNAHNWHFWTYENPFVTRERAYQHRFSLNLWCGIVNNNLVSFKTIYKMYSTKNTLQENTSC